MSYKISQIEGIGEAYARKLEDAGIGTVEQLLDMCSGKKGEIPAGRRDWHKRKTYTKMD